MSVGQVSSAATVRTGRVSESGGSGSTRLPTLFVAGLSFVCSPHALAFGAQSFPVFPIGESGSPTPLRLPRSVDSVYGEATTNARAIQLLADHGRDAVACFHELLTKVNETFDSNEDSVAVRVVEDPNPEESGPYVVIEIHTQRPFDAAYQRLDHLRDSYWIQNWGRARRLRLALRIS